MDDWDGGDDGVGLFVDVYEVFDDGGGGEVWGGGGDWEGGEGGGGGWGRGMS